MQTYHSPGVKDYIFSLPEDDRNKLIDFIRLLGVQNGKLSSGHTKYVRDKIWELKFEHNKRQHRVLYAIISGEILVLLIAFTKKTQKTPPSIINKAIHLRKIFSKTFK